MKAQAAFLLLSLLTAASGLPNLGTHDLEKVLPCPTAQNRAPVHSSTQHLLKSLTRVALHLVAWYLLR